MLSSSSIMLITLVIITNVKGFINHFKLNSLPLAGAPIPVDISKFEDNAIKNANRFSEIRPFDLESLSSKGNELLVPNTDIVALDGANNLATLLFAYCLYTGVFTSIINPSQKPNEGRPADIILPLVAKITGSEDDDWFINYQDGYNFECPPIAEFVRVSIFLILGYYINILWVNALDGDTFWGWSTACSLTIPALFVDLFRKKAPSREEAELRSNLEEDFATFSRKRLSQNENENTSEIRIIKNFRREYVKYRDSNIVPDSLIIKVVRQRLGCSPNLSGDYLKIQLTTRMKEGRLKLEATQKKLQVEREKLKEIQLVDNDTSNDIFDNEFVRK